MEHVDIPAGEIHQPHNWQWADAAARLAQSGLDESLTGKFGLQLDDGTLWRLASIGPATWAQVAATAAWDDVTGKPSEFPPSAHTHTVADVDGLDEALGGKQPVGDYEAEGAAAAAVAAHVALSDPHPTYTTAAELSAAISAHAGAVDPHPTYTTAAELSTALSDKLDTAGGTVTGAVALNGGVTLGDAPGDALTINSNTASIPNGLNITGGSVSLEEFYLSTGNVFQAGREISEIFTDDSGTAKAGVSFNRNVGTGGGTRSSAEIRFATTADTAGGGAYSTKFTISGGGAVTPGADNTQSFGTGALRWSVIYAGTGTINTSDAREKTVVAAMTANEIAASKVLASEIGTFKFLDAIATKGDDARLHVGMTVQSAVEIMTAHGLDPMRYGFICYDEWEAIAASEDQPARPAGNRYSFRTDELALFLARGFEARLAALESQL